MVKLGAGGARKIQSTRTGASLPERGRRHASACRFLERASRHRRKSIAGKNALVKLTTSAAGEVYDVSEDYLYMVRIALGYWTKVLCSVIAML